jgi:hypothetical protein
MNEQQIQELKNLVDKLQAEGLPQEQIQAQVDAKKQEFQQIEKPYNEGMSPDFQTPTTPGAVVEETAAPDTESKSEDGSSVSIEDRAIATAISSAPGVTGGGFTLAKSFFNLAKGVPELLKGAKETVIKQSLNLFGPEGLNEEQKNQAFEIAYNATRYLPGGNIIDSTVDFNNEVSNKLENIDTAFSEIKFDNPETSILEDFKSGNIKDAIGKTTDGVIEAVPSVMAAFSGIGGLAVIGTSSAGSNYAAKAELDPTRRGDLSTFTTSLGQGAIELASEYITRGLLKGSLGVFKNFTPNAVKNGYKAVTKNAAGRVFAASQIEGISENVAQEANRAIDALWDEKNLFKYRKVDKNGNISYDVGNILERGFDTWLISSIVGGGIGLRSSNNTPMDAYAETKLESTNSKKATGDLAKQINDLAALNKENPDPLIEQEINSLQDKIAENKKLNRRVLESFEHEDLLDYARRKIQVSQSKQNTKGNAVAEKIIQKEEKKLDKKYSEQKALILMLNFGPNVTNTEVKQKVQESKNKKASDEVQKIYDEKGAEGAFEIIEKFKPITNKLVRKRREAPNYDEQLLRDEIETGQRGILDLIREYKPDSGVPLSGYINKFLPARAIEASKRVLGEEFTQDVTEIRESRIELDDTTQEVLDFVRTEPKAKEQLRDIAGITKESVQKDATEILKGKLPGIIEKSGRDQNEILTAINNASKLKISDSVLEEMGGNFKNTEEQNSRFATFLDTNYDAIIKSIPDAVKNKLPVFEKIDTGKREQTKEGKKIFEYKTPTKEQMLSFYTEGGLTTLRARKLKLSDILAQEIGKDAIAEVLADPNIQKEFLERQELLGKEIPKGAIPKFLERIDRAIEQIETFEKTTLQSGIIPVTKGVKIALKTLKTAIQAGNTFAEAIGKAITAFKKSLKGKVTSAQSQAAVDVINSYLENENDLEGVDVNELSSAIKDAIENQVNLGKQGSRFSSEINKVNLYESIDKNKLSFKLKDSETLKNISKNRLNVNDKNVTDEFRKHSEKLSEFLPLNSDLLKGNKTFFTGLFGYHRRSTGDGKTQKFYDNFGKNKKANWISEKTNNLFNNITEIITATKFEKLQEEISKAKTKEQKIQIAKNNLEALKQQNANVKNTYNAFNNFLTDYLYNSKNQKEFESRLDYMIKLKRFNSSNIKGERDLVILNGFYFGKAGKTIKLEHVKSSSQQSLESLLSIISGKFDSNIVEDFSGVYGYKKQFDIIDKEGRTNTSKYFRFKSKKLAEQYLLVESNFDNSIYQKNVKNPILKSNQKLKNILNIKENINNIDIVKNAEKVDKTIQNKIKEKYNSKDLNKDFNNFLEKATGIGAQKVFSKAKAEARAKTVRKGFGDYFVPPGAEDFAGLMHKTLAKGKEGEKQLKFYQDNLYTPYNVANENITRERAAMFEDFRALKKKLSNVPKKLKQFTKGGDFTNDQAVRAFIWARQGNKVPGLSKTDARELINEVKSDKELLQFANELLSITKGDGYKKPENNWMAGNIATDLMTLMNSSKRSKHLEVWQNNVDQIFNEQNLNKLEAAYGKEWVTNLKKTLERMKTGSNRKWGGDKVLQSYLDWVNGSVGAIMFLNTRSAVLQTISNINYLNFSDNNPLQAAKAFANQKQYWSDFKTIFNSDYLQERRGGNKINVNESELALAAEKGGIQGTISLLLNKGFIFTKIADSFAIASGGASMYRNRIKTYIKQGLSEAEATEKAFVDFKAITEETQQSSRPDRISEQQASNAGRLFLAFANTPMQYNRIIKKNAQDLVAGRGNRMEKVSKIIYYSTIQNLIFNAMQKALFALAFSEDDEEEKEIEKYSQIANGMADSLLRGMGMTGNAAVAVKNIATDIANRMNRPRPNFQDAAWKALTISPPIYSKVSKLRGAGYSLGYTTPENIFEPKLDNPALSAGANIISATTNVPLDRALRKAQNIEAAMSDEAEWWQSTALLMGWGSWELGMENQKDKKEKLIKRKSINRQTIKRESITRK